MPIKIATALFSSVILFLVGLGTGWKLCSNSYKSEQLKQVNASVVELKQRNSAESKESVNREKAQEINHDQQTKSAVKVQYEVTAVPVYNQCIVPASGLQLINDAVESAHTLIASC